MSGTLFVVGTPIGNLGDISSRALDILENCDFIAAEDTRVSLKLLNHFGIKKPMVSYHEHNRIESGERIVSKILQEKNCCLVTDAGMPAISDPGEDLVRLCIERGIKVESVPGPCAFTTALAVSGMPSRRFSFEGFLPIEKNERKKILSSISKDERTLIFYEAPHKLSSALKDLADALGDRELAIVRELTKIHEQVIKTTLCEAAKKYAAEELKGEIVLIIKGAAHLAEDKMTFEQAVNYAKELVSNGETKTNAAKLAAKESDFKKNDIYKELI